MLAFCKCRWGSMLRNTHAHLSNFTTWGRVLNFPGAFPSHCFQFLRTLAGFHQFATVYTGCNTDGCVLNKRNSAFDTGIVSGPSYGDGTQRAPIAAPLTTHFTRFPRLSSLTSCFSRANWETYLYSVVIYCYQKYELFSAAIGNK